jgi:hypothetical protein
VASDVGVPNDWEVHVASTGQVGQRKRAGAQRECAGTAALGAPAQVPQARAGELAGTAAAARACVCVCE